MKEYPVWKVSIMLSADYGKLLLDSLAMIPQQERRSYTIIEKKRSRHAIDIVVKTYSAILFEEEIIKKAYEIADNTLKKKIIGNEKEELVRFAKFNIALRKFIKSEMIRKA